MAPVLHDVPGHHRVRVIRGSEHPVRGLRGQVGVAHPAEGVGDCLLHPLGVNAPFPPSNAPAHDTMLDPFHKKCLRASSFFLSFCNPFFLIIFLVNRLCLYELGLHSTAHLFLGMASPGISERFLVDSFVLDDEVHEVPSCAR